MEDLSKKVDDLQKQKNIPSENNSSLKKILTSSNIGSQNNGIGFSSIAARSSGESLNQKFFLPIHCRTCFCYNGKNGTYTSIRLLSIITLFLRPPTSL